MLYCRFRGFTLIELLVVIAILAILAGILFPVFMKARAKAREGTCLINQRQIVIAMRMYINDNDDQLPDANSWKESCNIDRKIFRCPDTHGNGYVYNAALSNHTDNFANPSLTMVTTDGANSSGNDIRWAEGLTVWYSADTGVVTDSSGKVQEWSLRFLPTYNTELNLNASEICFSENDVAFRHTGKAVMSFLDGHVALMKTVPLTVGEPLKITADTGGSSEGASTAPVLVTNGLAGQPTIRFVAENKTCLKNNEGFGVNFNSDDFTVVMIRKMNPTPGFPGSYSTILGTPGMAIRVHYLHFLLGDGSVDEQSFTVTPPVCMWSLAVDGTSYKTYLNGNSTPQNDGTIQRNPSASGQRPAYVGRELLNWPTYSTFPASMDLSEMLIFKRALSPEEIAAVYSRLQGKYALP